MASARDHAPLKFKDSKSNAWKLVPSDEVRFNQKAADAAMQGVRPPGGRDTGIRPPVGGPDDSWLDDLEAGEESLDLLHRPYMYLRRRILIDVRHALDYPVRVSLRGFRGNAVRDGQVTARCQVIAVFGDDLMRLLLVRHEVQGADAQHTHRLGKVELGEHLRVPEDLGRPAQIAEHDTDRVAPLEQRLAMRADHRIVVDVHHTRVRRDRLRHLVHAVLRGQAGAEVEKLADARLPSQEADHPADERPVVTDHPRDIGERGGQLLRGPPVGREVVLAAQNVVVDPGHVRHRRIDASQPRAVSAHPYHHLGI